MPTLLTWTDRGHGPAPHHRADDTGPILRLLDHSPPYDKVLVVTPPRGLAGAQGLTEALQRRGQRVELRLVDVSDPSDHHQLFTALAPLVRPLGEVDVLLSAGTPQVQTLWVILNQAGLLRGRMLQVIPPHFVPDPHPHPVREVRLDIEGFPEIRALEREIRRLRATLSTDDLGLVGDSPAMHRLRRRILQVARVDAPVFVLGETGTGKELVARAIHANGPRAGRPFIAFNGAALDDNLALSELFGHEAGAFSGAQRRRKGLFELAHTGTLLIDEVAELSPRVQAALLRVLQEGRFRRVGGEQEISVDVRVLAASHTDLQRAVSTGDFREDLYYRLAALTLSLPPLRERPEDIGPLAAHFLAQLGRAEAAPALDLEALTQQRWPGNVRELRAAMVRWLTFGESEPQRARSRAPGVVPLHEAVAAAELRALRAAQEAHPDNLSAQARALGIDRNTLKRKRARHAHLLR